jgi:Protein of unknown function (DUF1036)
VKKIVALGGGVALLASGVALAEIQVCNLYKEAVFVALGWVEDGDTQTQGWWQVDTGKCVIVDKRTLRTPHYFHAETSWRSDGAGHKLQQEWGSGKTLAVGADNFQFSHAQVVDAKDTRAEFMDLTANMNGFKSLIYTILADGVDTLRSYRPDP